MQSEDFYKKIRDAAEHHHPAYDDKAWMKMEQLLNKHMPVEKDRKRRFLLILFFFLLLGGGAFVWYGSGNLTGTKREITKTDADIKKEGDQKNNQSSDTRNVDGKEDSIVNADNEISKDDKIIADSKNIQSGEERKSKDQVVQKGEEKKKESDRKIVYNKNTRTDHGMKNVIISKEPATLKSKTDEKNLAKNNDKMDLTHIKTPSTDSLNLSEINKPAITKLSRKKGIFFLAASVAPDLSVVGLNEIGKIRTGLGFGLGYTRGRITVRSGLYSGRKVYEAYPEDYKAPAAFYRRYPNLQEVKADCKVYEIPLLVSYNLKKSGNGHWFMTTGISSYLMKRETYDYYYKWNLSDPVVHRERTIRNANKHYFSVVTLSAGYQRLLSKKISLVAEPYLKMPLTGIGFGKVKLNSAGVLLSVTYKPFGSKK